MYEVDSKDKVVKVENVPQSSVGAPCPTVVAGEHDVFLSYYVETVDASWDGTSVKIVGSDTEGETVAVVRFDTCSAHFFGPPNDEAFSGHPLYSRGLRPYSVFEIEKSSWIRKLEKMNAVHPYHDRDRFMKDKKHFIFSFHDTVFECIAKGFTIEVQEVTMMKVAEALARSLR